VTVEFVESKPPDQGLGALVILLRFHGISADPAQIEHRFGAIVGISEMLRCAKELGLKARARTTSWERLADTPLPGILALRDGGFVFLAKGLDPVAAVAAPTINNAL
jgi:ATP-binding cassette, subfamily B, bacterial HlyB/CyaB